MYIGFLPSRKIEGGDIRHRQDTWAGVFATLDAVRAMDWEGRDDPPEPAYPFSPWRDPEARREPEPEPRYPFCPWRPWWEDTSELAQRRRALKRWTGSGGKEAVMVQDARIQQLWRLSDEGLSYRQIAHELGWKSTGSVHYHLSRPRPKQHDVALSAILQRADEAARVFAETPACSMPVSSMREGPSTRFRYWPESIDCTEENTYRRADGTWWVGPYRC